MSLKAADIENEYKKNKGLRKEDVKALKEWADVQPHLPPISELQAILFLQSCYFSIEFAKTTIDTFCTIRTHCPEFFANRDPNSNSVKEFINMGIYQPLPKLTNENYRVIFCKLIDMDASKYVFADQLKLFDMSMMHWLSQEGTEEGIIIVNDMDQLTFTHFLKLSVLTMKKFLTYLQDGMPVRLKGLHFINVVPFMDKVMAMMKPFMKKELMDILHIHSESIDGLYKYVPKECLPKDYGGSIESVAELHEYQKKRLIDNRDYFIAEEKHIVDESKRPGKPKNAGDLFGVEGTFKKLDID